MQINISTKMEIEGRVLKICFINPLPANPVGINYYLFLLTYFTPLPNQAGTNLIPSNLQGLEYTGTHSQTVTPQYQTI